MPGLHAGHGKLREPLAHHRAGAVAGIPQLGHRVTQPLGDLPDAVRIDPQVLRSAAHQRSLPCRSAASTATASGTMPTVGGNNIDPSGSATLMATPAGTP